MSTKPDYEAMWKALKDDLEYTANHHEYQVDERTGVVSIKRRAEIAMRFVERMDRIETLHMTKSIVVPMPMEPT